MVHTHPLVEQACPLVGGVARSLAVLPAARPHQPGLLSLGSPFAPFRAVYPAAQARVCR